MKKIVPVLSLLLLAANLFAVKMEVPASTQIVQAKFTATRSVPVKITFFWKDGTRKAVTVKPGDANYLVNSNSGERYKMPEAGYFFHGLNILDYVRGNIALLQVKERKELIKTYAKRPPLPAKKYTLTVVNKGDGAQFFINGNLASFMFYKSKKYTPFTKIDTTLTGKDFRFSSETPCEKFHKLSIENMNNPGSFKDAKVTFNDDGKIPFHKVTSANIDLGKTAKQRSLYPNSYGNSGQTGRNAFDHADASYIFSVPMRQYSHVWILCAADTNPAKEPTFTARITRYVPSGKMGGRAYSALGDTRVDLRKAKGEQIGNVKLGKKVMPLWRLQVPLDMGKIIDLVTDPHAKTGRGAFPFHYLDFELMGITPLYRTPFTDPRVWPSTKNISSIHVFGATLQRSKIDMRFLETTPSRNMFDDTMKPEMIVEYKRVFPGKYLLEWTISDHTGKVLRKDSTSLDGAKGAKTIDLSMKKLGWYEVVYTVKDLENKEEILTHKASFALMGKDTRKAGFDSPYIGWSRGTAHYGSNSTELQGLRAKMLGVRRLTNLDSAFRKMTEKDWEKYKITTLIAKRFTLRDMAKYKKQGEAKVIEEIRESLKKFPHANQVPLLWENATPYSSYAQAPELYGYKPEPYSEARKAKNAERAETIRWAQNIVRKHFPHLQIMYGNSLASSELIAEVLRTKPAKNFTDFWGTEAIQRTAHPEKPYLPFTMMTSYEMNRTAEYFGYGHIKTSTGPENIARKADLLGLHRHAEWFVRDMLVQYIFGFKHIAGANDGGGVGNSYDSSFWAGGPGRAPYYYPNPSASATGTFTKIMDQVQFKRLLPTSSNTVYCAEFERAYDKKIIYALWTSRGSADLEIKTNSSNVEHVEFHGHSSKVSVWFRKLKLTAGTAVQYLITDKKLASIKITGRSIPHDPEADPKEFYVVDEMDSAAKWKLHQKKSPEVEGNGAQPRCNRVLAKNASVKEVMDKEMGKCLALSIKSDRKLNEFFSEYMVIRPEKPILIKDKINTIGLWVKGNSGWGQIYFELEDAKGIRRVSSGTAAHGSSDLSDFTGRASIDYDGAWAFLPFPVTEDSKLRDLSTGSVRNCWAGPWKEPEMPCKLTGIYFCAPVKPLYHNTPKYVDQTILIKNVSARTEKIKPPVKGDYIRKVLVLGAGSQKNALKKEALERDWGIGFRTEMASKQKKWYDNGIIFPHFEHLANDNTDAVIVCSAVTKNSLKMVKQYAENGGVVILGYTAIGQTFSRDKLLAKELFGVTNAKALHKIPYTQKESLEHEFVTLPAFGQKRVWKRKMIYAPMAAGLAGATPLIGHGKEKDLYMATINKVGAGFVIFCGNVTDSPLVLDLLDFAFRKQAEK